MEDRKELSLDELEQANGGTGGSHQIKYVLYKSDEYNIYLKNICPYDGDHLLVDKYCPRCRSHWVVNYH